MVSVSCIYDEICAELLFFFSPFSWAKLSEVVLITGLVFWFVVVVVVWMTTSISNFIRGSGANSQYQDLRA